MFKKFKNLFKKKRSVRQVAFYILLHTIIRDCFDKNKIQESFPEKDSSRMKIQFNDGLKSLYNITKPMPKTQKEVELKKITTMLYLLLKFSAGNKNKSVNLEKI